MNIQEGDQVLVNLSPFIGSLRRNKEAIPCRVLAVDGPHVEIRTVSPYREFSLRVQRTWIEGRPEPDEGVACSRVRSSTAAEVRQAAWE
jgi:hypothetical protein